MMMVDCFDAMVLLVTRRSPFDNPACTGIYVDAFQVEDTQAGTKTKRELLGRWSTGQIGPDVICASADSSTNEQ